MFITDRLNSGEVEEGGPFMGEKGVTGGLMIYSSEDAAAVEKTVKQDPFITNGVAVYELRTWFKCVSAK